MTRCPLLAALREVHREKIMAENADLLCVAGTPACVEAYWDVCSLSYLVNRPKEDFDEAAPCSCAVLLAQQRSHLIEQPDCTYLSSQIAIHNTKII